ncbi:hypothetical protein D0Z07_8063 [Hyphodiscus hymeniophilus]|uniref:Uncharacterized protein n=1 Tax=Hyphodiscus hymeniophilus TaxID=353542 RepID=A0A9P6VDX1_9HELO|nr:hypothetical protein D0Z07_8063 [Hyphodiscus hymeniophilus]
MADQAGTPGSNADNSVNGGKAGATKDKKCPFCNQAFTSSSLGRHLDLYLKEKNPKPADGIHDVVEIRKLRGGITRRQPRNSTSRREDSTPAGTPGAQERRSPAHESDVGGKRSPNLRRESGAGDMFNHNGKAGFQLNQANWESTGVINNIPITRNGGSVQGWDGEERDDMRRAERRRRSISKQMLAKTTFEQKQKMIEALDNAKAAELALRELMGSIRAAKQRINGTSIFDYDPLTLDFPALTLHCLPPPPTIYQSSPLPNTSSWSVLPPDDQQYQALRAHFSSEFRKWRVSCAIATTTLPDDLSYPPPNLFSNFDDPTDIAQQAEADATDLEAKISDHLHQMFAHWTSLSIQKRSEIWTLELARSVGRKSSEVQRLKREKELSQQETAHLKLQIDEVSRLQHPREFRLNPPSTTPIDSRVMAVAGEMGVKDSSVGFNLVDRNEPLDQTVLRAIGRWKGIVKEARGAGPNSAGMAAQRSLSGELQAPPQPSQNRTPRQQNGHHISPTKHNQPSNPNLNGTTNNPMMNGTEDLGSDEDADADADMEEDDSFVETEVGRRAPEAQMAHGATFRLSNGASEQRTGMDGLENTTCVAGYVRIGA